LEVRKNQFQFTERSFAVCNTYNCHRQHYLQSNSTNFRTSGLDKFKLHSLKLAFCNLDSSRLIACHRHLNCTQLLNCHTDTLVFHSQDLFTRPWKSNRKAKFGQKKLAPNKTSLISLFHELTFLFY